MGKALDWIIGAVEIGLSFIPAIAVTPLGAFLRASGMAMLLNATVRLFVGGSPSATPLSGGIDIAYSGTLEPRRIIYGRLKVGGMHALPPLTSGTNNDYFHQVLVLAGHPVTAIDDVYFGQVRIPSANIGAIAGNANDGKVSGIADPPAGQVNGKPYNDKAWIRRYTGTQSSVDYILSQAVPVWDSNHIGYGLTYLALQFKHDTEAYSGGVPQVSAMVRGKKIYDPRQDSTNGGSGSQRYATPSTWAYSTNPALCLRDYLTQTLGEDNARIDDVLVAAAANKCDENVSVPTPVLAGLCNWTNGSNQITGTGTGFLATLQATNYLKGPNGTYYQIASIQSDTQLTLSGNYPGTTLANQVTQYNTTNNNWTQQKRFTCNTALDATSRFEDIVGTLAGAMMGHCLYSGGKWRMYAGGWPGNLFTLTEADLVGGVAVQCTTPRKDLYNSVRGNYIDPQQNFQPTEFPAIVNSSYITEDGGETIYCETNFPCCNDTFEAQRNAIVLSRQSRNRRSITAQFGMSAFRVRPRETGTVTIAEIGWNAQTVRCTAWRFLPQGVIELTLQEAYEADWTDPLTSDYSVKGINVAPIPLHYLPYPPTNLTADSVPSAIEFTVTLPDQVVPGTLIELWEYTADTPFSSSVLVATGTTTKFTLAKADTTTRYYWVRTRGPMGGAQVSTTYPATTGLAAAAGQAVIDPWIPQGSCIEGDAMATKVGGSAAWDSCVSSLHAYQTCHVSAKCGKSGTARVMVGLSQAPDNSASYTNADFAVYFNGGTLMIYESGSQIVADAGDYTVNDVLSIVYDGTTATYQKNGATLHTTTNAGLTLYGFCPFYDPDSKLNALYFGPTTDLNVIDTPEVADGAATDVYTATFTNAGPLGDSGSQTNLVSLSIGPYAFDTLLVVSISATANVTEGTLTNQKTLINFNARTFSTSICDRTHGVFIPTAGGTTSTSVMAEGTHALAANTTLSGADAIWARAYQTATDLTTTTYTTGILKVEVIKR